MAVEMEEMHIVPVVLVMAAEVQVVIVVQEVVVDTVTVTLLPLEVEAVVVAEDQTLALLAAVAAVESVYLAKAVVDPLEEP
jgi:hypothetical protein